MTAVTDSQIANIVYNSIADIPVGISGILTTIVDQQVYFAEQLTGNNISVSSIGDAYQPGVTSLSQANVLSLMESQGVGTKSVSIGGELTITKNGADQTSQSLQQDGITKLKAIGERMSYYQTFT